MIKLNKISLCSIKSETRKAIRFCLLFFVVGIQGFSQCPPVSYDFIVTGASSTDYTLNTGDTLYLDVNANYTGFIDIYGGVLINCSSVNQTLSLRSNWSSTPGSFINNGEIVANFTGDVGYLKIFNYGNYVATTILGFTTDGELENHGVFEVAGNLELKENSIINNYNQLGVGWDLNSEVLTNWNNHSSGVVNCQRFRPNGPWLNQGLITTNEMDNFYSAVGVIDGGCINSVTSFSNYGSINGMSCGTITIGTNSFSNGTLSGHFAIVDETLSDPADILDIDSGTTNATVINTSCGCGSVVVDEICNNGIDDDFNDLIDGLDPTCDFDSDGLVNYLDVDKDNDGMDDQDENDVSTSDCSSIKLYTLYHETFGSGSRIESDEAELCYENGAGVFCSPTYDPGYSESVDPGEYSIVSNSDDANQGNYAWATIGDFNGDANGRMMVCNPSAVNEVFYSTQIDGLIPYGSAYFTAKFRNLYPSGTGAQSARVRINFLDTNNVVLATKVQTLLENDQWYNVFIFLNFSSRQTIKIEMVNENPVASGNDFVMDDIIFRQTLRDCDGDGVPNLFDLDSDNDGITDIAEQGNPDADFDGMSDNIDGGGQLVLDLNNNGQDDNYEGDAILDTDADGINDILDWDSDNDGLHDVLEAGGPDSNSDGRIGPTGIAYQNGNGLSDIVDPSDGGTGLAVVDSDADGTMDAKEIDSDGDGCFDVLEAGFSDPDNDGILGSSPVSVNNRGKVTSGSDGYTGTNSDVTNAMASSGCPDSDNDNDGILDRIDLDDDNDGILDSNESYIGERILWITNTPANPSEQNTIDRLTGMGYIVTVIDHWITENANNYDALFIFEEVHSANVLSNIENLITTNAGIVFSENALHDEILGGNNGDETLASEVNIIESSHPITEGLSTGTLDIGSASYHAQSLVTGTHLGLHPNGEVSLAAWEKGELLDDGSHADGRRVIVPNTDEFNMAGEDLIISAIQWSLVQDSDSDNDGVYDRLDLDSDNDGIYDVIEAGGSDPDNDGVIGVGSITDTDNDGWSDITDPDNGGTILLDEDVDTDGTLNRIDLDSDGDGCNDVIEAGFPDADNNGLLGTGTIGSGLIVNSQGLVTP